MLVAGALLALAGEAQAGRSGFAWFFDTEVVPERGVELESWIIDENSLGGDRAIDTTRFVWLPVVGVTDRVELALPVELDYIELDDPMVGGRTGLAHYGAELRWRLASPDRLESGPIVPLVRVAARRLVAARERVRGEGNLVLSVEGGAFRAVADAGFVTDVGTGEDTRALRPGAGMNLEVATDLRVGVEAFAVFNLDGDRDSDWLVVGPNLAWTHGRFWLAATFGVGVFGVDSAPRINWAVAF